MVFNLRRMSDMEMNWLFKVLREGLEENAGLDEKKKIVNYILPVYKYKLLQRFLRDEHELTEEIKLNCLLIFLDENTKYFNFIKYVDNEKTVEYILELIPKLCTNLETADLRSLCIEDENLENFKRFLKNSTQLKSLRVLCCRHFCALNTLLLEEDFNNHDVDIQNGLLKIDYIDGFGLRPEQCAKLLTLLPNLKSFGMYQEIGRCLYSYSHIDDIAQKLYNITEFHDVNTSLTSLERFVKFCPLAEKISLCEPQKNVVKNMQNFPLLMELILTSLEDDFIEELIHLLKEIGRQIKILTLNIPEDMEYDRNILSTLLPELIELNIETIALV